MEKAPHWVMLVGVDDLCFYFHVPTLPIKIWNLAYQYIPIARADFGSVNFGQRNFEPVLC